MRTFLIALLSVSLWSCWAMAQENGINPDPAVLPTAKDAPQIPKRPLKATFSMILAVDLKEATIDYLAVATVTEIETRTVMRTIVTNGVPTTVVDQVPVTVTKLVTELRRMSMKGVAVVTTTGRKMTLEEVANEQKLEGRDILIASGGEDIDPFYRRYLAKDLLILIPPAAAPKAPAPGK